jgi:hypothetical protein
MKIFNWIPALALSGLMASTAFAAPNLIVGSDSINIGGAATIDLTFQADGVVAGLDFTFTFDDAQFTATPACVANLPTTGTGTASVICSVSGNTVSVLIAAPVEFPVPMIVTGDQSLGSISFQSAANVPVAGYDLTITSENYFDNVAGPVTPTQSTDGLITVNAGPQPVWGDEFNPVVISGQVGSGTLISGFNVNNDAGEDGSVLNYTCSETADPDNKLTLGGQFSNIDVPKGSLGLPSISCDRTVIGNFTGEVQCTHNGTNTSPVVVPISCAVNAGPQAMFSGTPTGLAMVAIEQGDPDPAGSLAITNTGDATTTVTGTCTLTGPDAQITLTNGAFSVDQGAAAHVVAVACDASVEGMYTNTLSCTHDGANATPVDYAVTCDVGPPGPAVYLSVPAPGAVIDMTTEDVPVGAVVPDQIMTITNAAAEANDRDLVLANCAFTGDAAITATAPTSPVAAQASTSVTFSCDTAAVGAYTGTYSCEYHETGSEVADGTATYTVNCGVREAASDIVESPVSGTALSMVVPIGGTGMASVNFSEILDEGVDATVDSCSFGTAIFSVGSTLPATVAAGGMATISVSGSDDGSGALTFSDTLTCTYTDTDSTPGTASWPITLTVLAQPIPTLSTWGLMLMILTLMGLGGIVIRRKVES